MARRIATIDPAYFTAQRDAEFTVIGTAAQRSDARGHVTGQTQYFEDVSYPGMTAPQDAPLGAAPRADQERRHRAGVSRCQACCAC